VRSAGIFGEIINKMQILFDKPDYKKLRNQGHVCVDMHFHSSHSDGAASVKQILDKARTLGIGVAVTDHNAIDGVIEAYKIKENRDFVIPGIEVKSDELVDILFYFPEIEELKKFYSKDILPKKKRFLHVTKTTIKMEELIKISKKYDCLISAAHPFGYSLRGSLGEIFVKHIINFDKISVFEAINGGNGRKQNLRSVAYIEKHSKGFTGGTDGHSIYPLGNIVTCAKAKTPREFLEAIKKKENLVIGTESKHGKLGEYWRYGINKVRNILQK
jgi:predicted metal-dependent phosphoesterase TrpH